MALNCRLSTNDHEIVLIRFPGVIIHLSASLFRMDKEGEEDDSTFDCNSDTPVSHSYRDEGEDEGNDGVELCRKILFASKC